MENTTILRLSYLTGASAERPIPSRKFRGKQSRSSVEGRISQRWPVRQHQRSHRPPAPSRWNVGKDRSGMVVTRVIDLLRLPVRLQVPESGLKISAIAGYPSTNTVGKQPGGIL